MPVRQVLRATSLYAAFLDASQYPNYLSSETERLRLLHRLGAHGGLPGDTPDLSAMLRSVPWAEETYRAV